MAQFVDPPKQFPNGDPLNQNPTQSQGFYCPQQGSGGPPPQSFYPSNLQPPGYMQPPAQYPQQIDPLYSEQQYSNQFPPSPYYGSTQNGSGTSPYPEQQHMPVGANASYYGTAPHDQYGNPVQPINPEDDKGLGSTVVGGAAGGFAGHRLGGGFLGSAAGALLGAVGLNAATNQLKDRRKKHRKGKCGKKFHGCHARRRRFSSSSSSSSN